MNNQEAMFAEKIENLEKENTELKELLILAIEDMKEVMSHSEWCLLCKHGPKICFKGYEGSCNVNVDWKWRHEIIKNKEKVNV